MSNILALLSLIIIPFVLTDDSTEQKPSLVIEFLRHGARSPSKKEPGFNDRDELTSVGQRQHYILGQVIANNPKYSHLVETYDPSEVYVRSTDFNRTLQSAQSQLRGIFEGKGPKLPENPDNTLISPPFADQDKLDAINKELEGVPTSYPENIAVVPIITVPKEEDNLLYNGPHNCPNSAGWYKSREIDENAKKVYNSLDQTVKVLNAKGHNITQLLDIFQLGDSLYANYYANHKLAEEFKDKSVFDDTLFAYDWFVNYVFAGTGDQIRTLQRNIAYQLLQYFEEKANKTSKLKWVMMSGHDTTLLGILGLLNVTNPDCLFSNHLDLKANKPLSRPQCKFPRYASNIFLEFYDAIDNNEAYVKVIYNGNTVNIFGREEQQCSLSEFGKKIKAAVVSSDEEFEEICTGTPKTQPKGGENWFRIIEIVLISFLVLLGVGLIVAIAYVLIKKRKLDDNRGFQRINDEGSSVNV